MKKYLAILIISLLFGSSAFAQTMQTALNLIAIQIQVIQKIEDKIGTIPDNPRDRTAEDIINLGNEEGYLATQVDIAINNITAITVSTQGGSGSFLQDLWHGISEFVSSHPAVTAAAAIIFIQH